MFAVRTVLELVVVVVVVDFGLAAWLRRWFCNGYAYAVRLNANDVVVAAVTVTAVVVNDALVCESATAVWCDTCGDQHCCGGTRRRGKEYRVLTLRRLKRRSIATRCKILQLAAPDTNKNALKPSSLTLLLCIILASTRTRWFQAHRQREFMEKKQNELVAKLSDAKLAAVKQQASVLVQSIAGRPQRARPFVS